MDINWTQLRAHLTGRFALGTHSLHGPDHWRRVERHAVALAAGNGGHLVVVRLFAVFHDVCRDTDGVDPAHGARGAALAARLRGEWFDLPDADFTRLAFACIHHTSGFRSEDPTIGACWDADRLDIWRAGYTPAEQYLSTHDAREWVRAGRFGPHVVPPRSP
ncbi:MAG TPA: hypothetical protein PLZ36_05860 [Armatimonadota bacterium]|nr:hypothetical protein [Armatimonadota bacterium]HOS43242.1 hypothetical protein [Armatimonadota bacterium]